MTAEEKQEVTAFLGEHTTLALATRGDSGTAAAALFYAEDTGLNLYFLSEPTSEHIVNVSACPEVSLVIAADCQDWQQLRGVQIKGRCIVLEEEERARAEGVYLKKFPFVGENPMLRRRVGISGIYGVRPRWIRLTDNRRGFSDKREWVL